MPFSTVSTVVGCGNEFGRERICAVPRIGEIDGRRQLPRLRPRQRAERRLQRAADAVGERVVVDSVGGADRGLAVTGRVPGETHARHKALPIDRRDAVRHARVAGEQQPLRRVREHRRLLAGRPGVHAVPDIGKGRAHFPAQSVIDCQPRRRRAIRPARSAAKSTFRRPRFMSPPA